MITAFIATAIFGICVVIFVIEWRRAPEGYQDHTGFNYTHPPTPPEETTPPDALPTNGHTA